MINGPTVRQVFNGVVVGQGNRGLAKLSSIDVNSAAVRSGAVYLDNSSGNSYRYSKKMQCWQMVGNVGVLRNGSRKEPARRIEMGMIRREEQRDRTKTFVQCRPEYYSHWLFKSLTRHEFVTRCDRLWDLQYTPRACNSNQAEKLGEIKAMCMSGRGVETLSLNNGAMVAVGFPFLKYNRQTAEILANFVTHHMQSMCGAEDLKQPWFNWLQLSGQEGELDVEMHAHIKYEPTSAPTFADLESCWEGRPAPQLVERSMSCPPSATEMSTLSHSSHPPYLPEVGGPCGPHDYWHRTCGPQLLMRANVAGEESLRASRNIEHFQPWQSSPISSLDRSRGVGRPRAAVTKYLMSMTRYLDSQRNKATSSMLMGHLEPQSTRRHRGTGRRQSSRI